MYEQRKIAVIGGGPAGMMGAIYGAMNGASVTLFEKNDRLGIHGAAQRRYILR